MFRNALTCFRKSFQFRGRSDWDEFWGFVWFLFLGTVLLVVIKTYVIGPDVGTQVRVTVDDQGNRSESLVRTYGFNSGLAGRVLLAICAIPLVSCGWRRMHDVGRPGWFVLLPGVAFAAWWGFAYSTLRSTPLDPTLRPQSVELPETYAFPAEILSPANPLPVFATAVIPLLIFVLTIVFLARQSVDGPNKYGPQPNEVTQ